MGLIEHTALALKMEKLNFGENDPKNFGDECVAWQDVILRLFVYKTPPPFGLRGRNSTLD